MLIDLHTHILPGLDDGSPDLETSVQMAVLAAKSGVRGIAATSHGNGFAYTAEEYQEKFRILKRELEKRNIPVRLYSGLEILVHEDTGILLDEGWLLTLGGTKNILIEFDFEEQGERVCACIGDLQRRGYGIVLAHPERYLWMQKNPDLAYFLEEKGCHLQVNKGSIFGQFGQRPQMLAKQFLADGIVSILASDAHDARYRTPSMDRLLRYLRERYSQEQIRSWLFENPNAILQGGMKCS